MVNITPPCRCKYSRRCAAVDLGAALRLYWLLDGGNGVFLPIKMAFMIRYIGLFVGMFPFFLWAQTPEIPLSKGLIIKTSCQILPGKYALPTDADTPFAITIEGNDLQVDFQGAQLLGAAVGVPPYQFTGIAILIKGQNITLLNAQARGYKIAVLAENVPNLTLENCDFSYNYRLRLYSVRERENFSDWLSFHQNEHDEWMRYGAGIYLKNCLRTTVKGCRITGGQNALLMNNCQEATVFNNFFTFNSGLGIGLYRSSRNKLMHNRLDWNVRGYSHKFYARGQDSAGILLYEQSSENTIAYNSTTHCGNGLFLWAGQSTLDSGEGGCNDNLIFGNDFSYAPTNGIEVTFSRNRIQGNLLRECTYGIWGKYSFESMIMGNYLAGCQTGIAIEHGQNDTIQRNLFQDDSTGISLWAREKQPEDGGYTQKRDTRSRNAVIDRNVFMGTRKPLKISRSEDVSVNGENLFLDFETLLEVPAPNQNLRFLRNDVYGTPDKIAQVWANPALTASQNINFSHPDQTPENLYAPLNVPYDELREPDSLPGAMITELPAGFPRGRPFIIIDEWGPFDFRRPVALLDTISSNQYALVLLGPSGDWKITDMKGIKKVSAKSGTVPTTLILERDPQSDAVGVWFAYTSPQAIKTAWGETVSTGSTYSFDFQRFEKKMRWETQFFAYDSLLTPSVFKGPVLAEKTAQESLYYAWWGSPAEGVPVDKFATQSTTSFDIARGNYVFELSSDDGARLYLDDRLLIDHWDAHEPATDEINVQLGGKHRIRIEQYDAGGFSTLGFRMY